MCCAAELRDKPIRLPAFHLNHKRLFDFNFPTVHNNTFCVGKVSIISVLKLYGVDHRLERERTERLHYSCVVAIWPSTNI